MVKIENYKSNNLYYKQILSWKKNRFLDAELNESFEPIESKCESGNIISVDIFNNPTSEENERFDKYWVNKISSRKVASKDYSDYLEKYYPGEYIGSPRKYSKDPD